MSDNEIKYIPVKTLEKMGFYVEDQGDGGLSLNLNIPQNQDAVDRGDDNLQILTLAGDVFYDSRTDDFDELYQTIRTIASGREYEWRKEFSHKGEIRAKFKNGKLKETSRQEHEAAESTFASRKARYSKGQITRFETTACVTDILKIVTAPQGAPPSEELCIDSSVKKDIVRLDDRLARNAGLKPQEDGWIFEVSGIPVRVYTDPALGTANPSITLQIINGVSAYPPGILSILSQARTKEDFPEGLAFFTVSPESLKDPRRLKKVLRYHDPIEHSSKRGLESNAYSPSNLDLLGARIYGSRILGYIAQTGAASASEHMREVQVYQAIPDNIHPIEHEIAHLLLFTLGGDFKREWESLFRTYLDEAKSEAACPYEDEGEALVYLTSRGYLPREYAGVSDEEFFAELVAVALHMNSGKPYVSKNFNPKLSRLLLAMNQSLHNAKSPADLAEGLVDALRGTV